MNTNLAVLRTEIQEHLASRGLVIFHSFQRSGDPAPAVYWDTARDSNFKSFVGAAEAAGVRMVTLFARELSVDMIEEALDQLADTTLGREERRSIESRLRGMRAYAGFTCEIELSFDLAQRVYIFDLRTAWFDDLNDVIDSIEDSYLDPGDEDDDESGLDPDYFSKN